MSRSLELWRNPANIDSMARRHYRDELEFHNYPHALDACEIAATLAEIAIQHEVDIERRVIKASMSYHDGGTYLWPGIDHPFSTREEYAADVSGRELEMLGMPQFLIDINGNVVRSTNHAVPCFTKTERCANQADLIAGGILSAPAVFLNGTYRLYLESKRLKGEQPAAPADRERLIGELVQFGGVSHEILLAYLEKDLSLGRHDRDAEGHGFNERAGEQVDLLAPARIEETLTVNFDAMVALHEAGLHE